MERNQESVWLCATIGALALTICGCETDSVSSIVRKVDSTVQFVGWDSIEGSERSLVVGTLSFVYFFSSTGREEARWRPPDRSMIVDGDVRAKAIYVVTDTSVFVIRRSNAGDRVEVSDHIAVAESGDCSISADGRLIAMSNGDAQVRYSASRVHLIAIDDDGNTQTVRIIDDECFPVLRTFTEETVLITVRSWRGPRQIVIRSVEQLDEEDVVDVSGNIRCLTVAEDMSIIAGCHDGRVAKVNRTSGREYRVDYVRVTDGGVTAVSSNNGSIVFGDTLKGIGVLRGTDRIMYTRPNRLGSILAVDVSSSGEVAAGCTTARFAIVENVTEQ